MFSIAGNSVYRGVGASFWHSTPHGCLCGIALWSLCAVDQRDWKAPSVTTLLDAVIDSHPETLAVAAKVGSLTFIPKSGFL